MVCLETYREDSSLALFFPQPGDVKDWIEAIETFARRMADYHAQDAQILAIFPLEMKH